MLATRHVLGIDLYAAQTIQSTELKAIFAVFVHVVSPIAHTYTSLILSSRIINEWKCMRYE